MYEPSIVLGLRYSIMYIYNIRKISKTLKHTTMKNFREEQINSTNEYCINQYWEKEVKVEDVNVVFHYWRRKEGYPGYNGSDNIMKVIGEKNGKKKQIKSVWITSLGEKYCIEQMIAKFN